MHPLFPHTARVQSQRGRRPRRHNPAVALEILDREAFVAELIEHHRHLRASQQDDRDQMVALKTGRRRRRPMPAAPRHQRSRPNSTITVDLGLAPSIGGNRSIHSPASSPPLLRAVWTLPLSIMSSASLASPRPLSATYQPPGMRRSNPLPA